MDKDKKTIKLAEGSDVSKENRSKVDNENSNPDSSTGTKPFFLKGPVLLFILVLILVVVTGVAIRTYQQIKQPQVKKTTVNKQVLQKRSKDPGVINKALTGKAIDVNTGKIVQAARIFSSNDKTVYLELDLNKPLKGTIIDYMRYKEGRYVDHGEVVLAKADINNLLFNWTINQLLTGLRDGKWKIATYTNGILAKRINYEIKSNKVTDVKYGEPIGINDPDYNLSHAFFLASNKGH